jgi:hypothetical protein
MYPMNVRFLLFISLLFVINACSHSPMHDLNSDGESVKISKIEGLGEDDLDNLEEIGNVHCEVGLNARDIEANIKACHNKLRNDAGKMGGDVIIVEDVDQNFPPNENKIWKGGVATNNIKQKAVVLRWTNKPTAPDMILPHPVLEELDEEAEMETDSPEELEQDPDSGTLVPVTAEDI